MEGNSYFGLVALPACLSLIGDKINHLRYSDIRTLVNAKLRESDIGGICVQFDVDDYDQVVAFFFKEEARIGDTFVIRSTTQKTLIERINEEYNKRFNKKEKKMKKQNCKVTTVTNANQADSVDVNMLKDYILQHFCGTGHLYELDKIGAINVSILCSNATAGAIVNISFDDTAFTINVASGDSIRCDVAGLNDEDLFKKVERRLQTEIRWYQDMFSEDAVVSNQALKEDIVAKNTTVSKKNGRRSRTAKEVLCKETTVSQDRDFKVMAVALGNDNSYSKYNEFVEQGIKGLKNELKTMSYRTGGQRIRGYLLKKARTSSIHVEDTSTKWLVSILDVKRKELLCTLYKCLRRKLPPFLQPYAASEKLAQRG